MGWRGSRVLNWTGDSKLPSQLPNAAALKTSAGPVELQWVNRPAVNLGNTSALRDDSPQSQVAPSSPAKHQRQPAPEFATRPTKTTDNPDIEKKRRPTLSCATAHAPQHLGATIPGRPPPATGQERQAQWSDGALALRSPPSSRVPVQSRASPVSPALCGTRGHDHHHHHGHGHRVHLRQDEQLGAAARPPPRGMCTAPPPPPPPPPALHCPHLRRVLADGLSRPTTTRATNTTSSATPAASSPGWTTSTSRPSMAPSTSRPSSWSAPVCSCLVPTSCGSW